MVLTSLYNNVNLWLSLLHYIFLIVTTTSYSDLRKKSLFWLMIKKICHAVALGYILSPLKRFRGINSQSLTTGEACCTHVGGLHYQKGAWQGFVKNLSNGKKQWILIKNVPHPGYLLWMFYIYGFCNWKIRRAEIVALDHDWYRVLLNKLWV